MRPARCVKRATTLNPQRAGGDWATQRVGGCRMVAGQLDWAGMQGGVSHADLCSVAACVDAKVLGQRRRQLLRPRQPRLPPRRAVAVCRAAVVPPQLVVEQGDPPAAGQLARRHQVGREVRVQRLRPRNGGRAISGREGGRGLVRCRAGFRRQLVARHVGCAAASAAPPPLPTACSQPVLAPARRLKPPRGPAAELSGPSLAPKPCPACQPPGHPTCTHWLATS